MDFIIDLATFADLVIGLRSGALVPMARLLEGHPCRPALGLDRDARLRLLAVFGPFHLEVTVAHLCQWLIGRGLLLELRPRLPDRAKCGIG